MLQFGIHSEKKILDIIDSMCLVSISDNVSLAPLHTIEIG